MSETTALIAIVVTHDEAKVWRNGLEAGAEPERVSILDARRDIRHGRKTSRHQGYEVDLEERALFDEVAPIAEAASKVILLGHGTGKASAMHEMLEHWRTRHPSAAAKVIATLDTNLNAMSDAQLLAQARTWWNEHREFVE